MNFFKIKRIAMKMDGSIIAICTGCEVKKTADGWVNEYNQMMTPLFDYASYDLVGFFDPKEVNVTLEED